MLHIHDSRHVTSTQGTRSQLQSVCDTPLQRKDPSFHPVKRNKNIHNIETLLIPLKLTFKTESTFINGQICWYQNRDLHWVVAISVQTPDYVRLPHREPKPPKVDGKLEN